MTMTQWFPKLAEFDSEGWHPNPYIGREFHGVWELFSKYSIDKNYVVGTGYLLNANEIGHGYSEKAPKKEETTTRGSFMLLMFMILLGLQTQTIYMILKNLNLELTFTSFINQQ